MNIEEMIDALPRGSSIFKSLDWRSENPCAWKYSVTVPHLRGAEKSCDRHKTFKARDLETVLKDALNFHHLLVEMPCLYCGKLHLFTVFSSEANGILNVFCPDDYCEDSYALTL